MAAFCRCAISTVLFASVMLTAAQAQKVDNPVAIPQNVRPGAIEAQLDVEVAPGVTMAPSVVSPYQPEQPADAASIEFQLTDITLDGAVAIQPSVLRSLYADRLGETLQLSEIFKIARAITKVYAEAGYPLSLAYVPIQEIENGVVRIRVIEGFIGEIDVSDAPARVRPHLRRLAAKITEERPLTQRSLERYLLLANKIPGLSVTGVMERGASRDSGVKMTLKVAQKAFHRRRRCE